MIRTFLAFGIAMLLQVSYANPVFIDSEQTPQGFETVKHKQYLNLHLVFLKHDMGKVLVSIDAGRLSFIFPDKILNRLPGTIKDQKVLAALSKKYPLNVECNENNRNVFLTFCSALNKQETYIIYLPERETVYLYFPQKFFKHSTTKRQAAYLPPPAAGWSYLNKLGAAGSFSTQYPIYFSKLFPASPNYYNLFSNNSLAYKNTRIVSNLSANNGINNGSKFQIQSLYSQTINRDKIYTGGYITTAASAFFQNQVLLGINVKTTLDTLQNKEAFSSTPLLVFVPEAAQVDIFKNERLIYSQYYSAGYQQINTENFPEGGYELIIKAGTKQLTRRFFSKGNILPPFELTQFYISGGYLSNEMLLNSNNYEYLPKILNIPVIQAGISQRIGEKSAFFGNLLIQKNQLAIDLSTALYLDKFFIKPAGLITSDGNAGAYLMLNSSMNRWNLNLLATKIYYKNRARNYYFLNNLLDNDSLSLSYRLSDKDLLGVQSFYNKLLDQPESYGLGSFYQRFIGNIQGLGFFFNAVYNDTVNSGKNYALGISMNFSAGRFSGTESTVWQDQFGPGNCNQAKSPFLFQGSTVYSKQDALGTGYALSENHSISKRARALTGLYNYNADSHFISTYASYNHAENTAAALNYGGNLETELIMNKNSLQFNGKQRGNTAGIIVEAVSDVKDKQAKFALINANHQTIAILKLNKKTFISLPGFTGQTLSLVNTSSVDYSIKRPMRQLSLYPGSVDYLRWDVSRRLIIIGRILNRQSHSPLAYQRVYTEEDAVFSDSEGYFQLEVSENTRSLHIKGRKNCTLPIPKHKEQKAYIYIGEKLCA